MNFNEMKIIASNFNETEKIADPGQKED